MINNLNISEDVEKILKRIINSYFENRYTSVVFSTHRIIGISEDGCLIIETLKHDGFFLYLLDLSGSDEEIEGNRYVEAIKIVLYAITNDCWYLGE